MKLVFLGTGGGRHSAMFQIRSCGGLLLQTEKGNVHIDPGPGALVNMNRIQYDLQTTDAIVITHCHPDHCSDAGCVIEGMTHGGWVKRGSLYGSEAVFKECGSLDPALRKYHIGLPEKTQTVKPGEKYEIAGLEIEATKSIHNDPTTFGMKIETENGILSYVSDTSFSEEIAKQYENTRVLILPLTVPDDMRIKGHMDLLGAIDFIKTVNPELVIFNHLGIRVIDRNPEKQAEKASKETGIPVVAAKDLMTVDFGKSIIFDEIEPEEHGWLPFW